MEHQRIRRIMAAVALWMVLLSLCGCQGVTKGIQIVTSEAQKAETERTEQALDPFEQVSVDLGVANITFIQGSAYHLSLSKTADYPISYAVQGDKLAIASDSSKVINSFSATLTITVPKEAVLKNVTVATGVGDFSASDLSIDQLTVKQGVGSFSAKNLSSTDLRVEVATGDCEISNCEVTHMNVDGSVGDVLIENVGTAQDTSYSLSADVGSIEVDGEKKKSPYKEGEGERSITVNVSVGDITIQ